MTLGLGILIGVLLTISVQIANLKFKQPIERTVNQLESSLKPKGRIIEPENDSLENLLNHFTQDDERREND